MRSAVGSQENNGMSDTSGLTAPTEPRETLLPIIGISEASERLAGALGVSEEPSVKFYQRKAANMSLNSIHYENPRRGTSLANLNLIGHNFLEITRGSEFSDSGAVYAVFGGVDSLDESLCWVALSLGAGSPRSYGPLIAFMNDKIMKDVHAVLPGRHADSTAGIRSNPLSQDLPPDVGRAAVFSQLDAALISDAGNFNSEAD